MKQLIILTLVLFTFFSCDKSANDGFIDQENKSNQTVTNRNLNLQFSTVKPGGEYAPNHILAVWIEHENGTFVRSLKVRASERKKYLYTWKSATGSNTSDAITGATISRHESHDIDWNFQDANRNDVPNGNYTLKLEMTDGNKQGPVASYNFAITDTVKSQSFSDHNYFKNVAITYTNITLR